MGEEVGSMAQPAAHNTRTILYAEDDETSRRVVVFFLKHLGYRLIMAVDGRDALEKYLANRQEIGLLMLDMLMPGMNGVEVLNEVRILDPGIKALFCTATPESVQCAFGGQDGITCVISKPVELELLEVMLQSLLGSAA